MTPFDSYMAISIDTLEDTVYAPYRLTTEVIILQGDIPGSPELEGP